MSNFVQSTMNGFEMVLLRRNVMAEQQTREEPLRTIIERIRGDGSEPLLLTSLIDEYEREFGPEANEEVLDILGRDTRDSWAEIARTRKNNSIEDLLDTLWKRFGKAGGKFTVKREGGVVKIHCTRCPMADTYKSIGRQEYGLIFHCSTDPYIVQGFNDRIAFQISKRLMSGDDCCDHSYSMNG